MRIAITGSTGLIGSALLTHLRDDGHEVLRLVRRSAAADDEVGWDPTGGQVELARLAGVEAVVHLAGAGVADRRWTARYRREIRESRVSGTRTLVRGLGRLDPPPKVLVSGSAIGFYGDQGDHELDESSPPGDGFLPDVVVDWEAAARVAEDDGMRVVMARSGLVMTPTSGPLGRLLPFLRAGLGGRIGSGRQWWSWITLLDEVAALRFLILNDVSGPVNLTAPVPVRNAEFVAAVAGHLHRPSLLPVPGPAIRAALGGFSEEVLGSKRVVPRRLAEAGFRFAHPDLPAALPWLLPEDLPA